jgi:hypothetical protein
MQAAAEQKADIFGAAAASDGTKKTKKAPRTMIKNCDSVAAKCLDPWGCSVLKDLSLEKVWEQAKRGDDYCKYNTNLAADDSNGGDFRVGIGISQVCEVMSNAIHELKNNEDLQKCIAKNVYDKAMAEATALLPHLDRLNAGKTEFKVKEESWGGIKKRRKMDAGAATPSKQSTGQELDESAEQLFTWVAKGTDSNLRMLIQIIGAGGVFYSANASDKVLRSFVAHRQPTVTKEAFKQFVKARQPPEASGAQSSSVVKEKATGGLFD